MYAPKFRSWMSNWDRFDEALEARLQTQGDEIMADVRRQIAEATPNLNSIAQGRDHEANQLWRGGYVQPASPFTDWLLGTQPGAIWDTQPRNLSRLLP